MAMLHHPRRNSSSFSRFDGIFPLLYRALASSSHHWSTSRLLRFKKKSHVTGRWRVLCKKNPVNNDKKEREKELGNRLNEAVVLLTFPPLSIDVTLLRDDVGNSD